MKYYSVCAYNPVTEEVDLDYDCISKEIAHEVLLRMARDLNANIVSKKPLVAISNKYIIKCIQLDVKFMVLKDDEVIYIGQDPNSIDLKQVGNYTVMRYPSYFIDENGSDLDIDIHIL